MATTQADKQFFDLFMLVIGILIAVTFALFLVARFIAGKTQEVYILEDKPYQEQVSENIRPIGRVALDGEAVAASLDVQEVEPAAEVLSGPQVYNQACLACHGAGVGGAPVTGNADAWKSRVAQGRSTLNNHVLNGYTGAAGFMPPKGGRIDLSDQEILAAIDYIIQQVP